MHGYAWVTGDGIYILLDGRWRKTTTFRPTTPPSVAEWDAWRLLYEPPERPAVTVRKLIDVANVRPGDQVHVDGATAGVGSSEVNTVLHIETLSAAPPTLKVVVLAVTAETASVHYEDRIEILGPSATRRTALVAQLPERALLFCVRLEMQSNSVQWIHGDEQPPAL